MADASEYLAEGATAKSILRVHTSRAPVDALQHQATTTSLKKELSFAMFLEEALIRYTYKDCSSIDDLSMETVKALVRQFDDEYAEEPFCNLGDFDLDDLREYIPDTWSIVKSGYVAPGTFRLAVVEIIYGAEQQFDTSVENVELEAFDLCGLHPLSCRDFEQHPDVFGEESYVPDGGSKSLLFLITPLAPRRPLWSDRVVHRYQCSRGPQRDPVPERSLPA